MSWAPAGAMPPRQEEMVKTKEIQVGLTIQHPLAPRFSLEDGNADKEAEKLIPSPNFYVLMVCSLEFAGVGKRFYRWVLHNIPTNLSKILPYSSRYATEHDKSTKNWITLPQSTFCKIKNHRKFPITCFNKSVVSYFYLHSKQSCYWVYSNRSRQMYHNRFRELILN